MEACRDLGIIFDTFPSIESVMTDSSAMQSDTDNPNEDRCHCPPCQTPPPLPTSLPFPATEENREKLERWLLDYYKSSTFNVCEHQELPMMSGPPMRLIIDDDATPITHHIPIPVPIHWQEQVKAGLDQDVRLGVIEPGYIASGDAYTRCFDEVVSDIDNKSKVIDDTIMWSPSIEDSFLQAAKWLDLCGRNGIILNPSKFSFAKETVNFAGFEITPTTVRPCPQVLEAIKGFPKPRTITDVRSWFGLINQVA
ncbi:enzymatic polyprotein [Plakobranchus ocellatus]|uniref:Enzymatic polyprotein n=1 Tax=Plakobranchus ocellatus TaxID=259542 RepID=A0AAV4CMT1_9GAST|nr:enzymatic polyprotein [Plakobranchus ocellatus]